MNEAPLPSRIKEIPEDHYTADQAKVIKNLRANRGTLLTSDKVWIHSPKVAEATEQLGTFLLKNSSLSEREVELGTCVIAHHWHGEYVWRSHVKFGLQLGIEPSVFDDIRRGNVPKLANPRERAVYEILQIAQEPGPGSDQIFDRSVAVLGRDGVAEVLSLLGYYSALAVALKLHRIPLPGSSPPAIAPIG